MLLGISISESNNIHFLDNTWEKIVLIGSTAQEIKQNTMIKKLDKITKEYVISIEVKPTAFDKTWTNVFHGTTGGNSGKYGYR